MLAHYVAIVTLVTIGDIPLVPSAALGALVAQAIERGDRCVLFDLTGHYMSAFYDPERDFRPVSHVNSYEFGVAVGSAFGTGARALAVVDVHGHGPDCTGIRKIVSYTLQPGDYILQLVGSGTPEMTALVLPVD